MGVGRARGKGGAEGSAKPSLCALIYGARSEEPLELLSEALASGADPGERCREMGRTPLMLAAQKGWEESVALLLRAGADPGFRDEFGRDALMLSLIARKVGCAKLLAGRSDASAVDAQGRNALALAAKHAPHLADAGLLAMLWTEGAESALGADGKCAMDYGREGEMACLSEFESFVASRCEARQIGAACKTTGLERRRAVWI